MEAIWFVMRTGCPWRALNTMALCSSATAERRYRGWKAAGVSGRLHRAGLDGAHAAGAVDRDFLAVDGCHAKAPLSRTERGDRRGSAGASGARSGRPPSTAALSGRSASAGAVCSTATEPSSPPPPRTHHQASRVVMAGSETLPSVSSKRARPDAEPNPWDEAANHRPASTAGCAGRRAAASRGRRTRGSPQRSAPHGRRRPVRRTNSSGADACGSTGNMEFQSTAQQTRR